MSRGRGAHYMPRVKDRDKREVSFSLVPSNLGKKGKVCSYSARLTHNQVLDEDAVVSEMCEEFDLPKNRVVQNLQQISDYLVSRIKKGYQVTFGGFTVGLSISGKFDAMNAEFDPEKNKVEVVVTPRYELTDVVAYLKSINEPKNTSRPELFAVLVLIMVSGCLMFYTGSEEGPFKVVAVRNEPGRPQEAILQSECRANWEVVFGPDGGGQKRRV